MAMGYVTDSDFEAELSRLNGESKSSVQTIVKDIPSKGRKEGDNNVPESLRKIIGENAIEEGSTATKELSRMFGISDSSVSAYKNGATSTSSYHTGQPELKSHMKQVSERIGKLANSKLMKAIKSITDEKLTNAKARDLAGIAKDLSLVARNTNPSENESNARPPVFVLHSPQFKDERTYQTLVVNE